MMTCLKMTVERNFSKPRLKSPSYRNGLFTYAGAILGQLTKNAEGRINAACIVIVKVIFLLYIAQKLYRLKTCMY